MSTVRWDCTHSHMLSSKAIAEGWDTFIFVKWTRYGGNLVVAWIVPPDYCNALNGNLDQDRVQKPENLIQLPSALVDDFKKNKFAIDVVRQNRLVTFPGISPETDILLRSYTFTLYSSNVPFLRTHFRLCLRLHCLAGDIFPEYEAQVDDRLESIDTSSGYGVHQAHEDPLDIALRQWLLSQAMSELDYAQN
ncbi:hypothetical protein WG66_002233 [Moniliophthora roreri]|uniref:Uncharacterized protein n=1 Tax=Moniliophthora roreri TaxID=221103 RepID=A0A0W0GDL0_MONRR|nr:hypothetical protein WG66_002233 [Moniliophthora roreri]